MSAATERTPLLTGHDHSRTDDNPSQQPQQTVLDGLDANILETGLTQQEADSRLKCDGPNEISDSNETPFLLLLRKFTGPTAYMLELTILVALLPWLRKYDVAVVVTILLLLNVFLAFSQEQKALRALDELKECLQLKCRVLRDGCWHHDLPARDLVKGDIVRLRLGDYVPADVVIVQGHVQVDNSALTGESVAVDAPKTSPVYAGARIITGEATALVTGTGASTFYGRTTQLIQLSHPKSHIDTIVKKVTLALVILLVVLLGLAGVILVREAGTEGLVDVLPLMLLLLASGVPVALPAMFTTATALGSLELARKGVLITRLNATEDAARMTILESDKTGTLTQNRLSVSSVHPYATDIHPCDVVYLGAIASLEANKDPIDLAFLEFAEGERGDVEGGEMGEDGEDGGEGSDDHAVALDVESGLTALQCGEAIIECPLKLDLQTLRQTLDVVKFLPFDPALRRWTGVILHRPPAPSASLTPSAPQKRSPKSDFPQQPTLSEYHLVVKGSVAEVSSLCGVAMDEYAEIEEVVERWAARGWRSLAVAATFDPHAMTDAGSSEGIAPTQTESDQHFQSASEVLQSSSVSAAPHILDHLSRSRLFLLGLVALMDPPRRDSKKVVAELNGLGVKVQMLTGDSLSIAKEIGADVGLNPEKMITMTEFHEMKRRRTERGEGRRERMESTALLSRAVERERGVEGWKVADMDGFAEILPEDKHTVVETLQKSGHVVGMTGDGVNDAPALKLAEVGIAMSNATDIAKGSASAILLHEGLSGVLSLVMVGRKIHQRIVTWVLNKIVKTFQSNVYIIVAFLVKGVFVVDAIHLLVLLFCVVSWPFARSE
ncbi:hypothetical protein HK102_004823 [Quaeritorhiza haematococci]|nr:hypothetical protein HK102_004823 [Quaeritorhiza haematococci]